MLGYPLHGFCLNRTLGECEIGNRERIHGTGPGGFSGGVDGNRPPIIGLAKRQRHGKRDLDGVHLTQVVRRTAGGGLHLAAIGTEIDLIAGDAGRRQPFEFRWLHHGGPIGWKRVFRF